MRPACSARAALPAAALTLLLLCAAGGCGASTSATHDDASISTRVKIALLNEPEVGPLRIDARTFQGVVTLSGTVRSQADVDRAIAAARHIAGVKDVKSELKIGGA
jgi:hyperosmotically inducible protein